MSDGGSAELAVQAEQRHQIDHRQRLGGNDFEVTQIGRIQFGGGQQVGEQLLVDFCTLPGSVFVEFDRDERRLGLATEAWDRPGVRVPLLEVVERSVYEVFAHLLPRSVIPQPVRGPGSVDGFN